MRVRPRSRLQMHSGNDINRWTVSFADFMTLMFAVFVVLYAVSSSKEEKYKYSYLLSKALVIKPLLKI